MEEKALTNSPFCRNILVLSILNCGVSLGYALTNLNPVTPVLEDVYNSTYRARYGENLPYSLWTTLLSLTMSMLLAGAFCGSIAVESLLRLLGTRRLMIFWSSVAIVGTLITSAIVGTTGSYEALIAGRFVIGFALGLSMNTGTVVAAEYSTLNSQAIYQSLMGVGITLGSVLGAVIGHPKVLGTADRWPAVVAISCILPLCYICISPWIPESAHTLLRRGKFDQAIKVLKKLRIGDEDAVMHEIRAMEKEHIVGESVVEMSDNSEKTGKLSFLGITDILRNPLYRRQLLTVAMLYGGFMITGVNHAILFSDRIFIAAGIPADIVTYATIGVLSATLISSFIGTRVLAAVGSRKLILGTLCITIVSQVMTTASLAAQHLAPAMGYVAIAGILLLLTSTAAGPGLAIYVLAGPLTIEPTRVTILKCAGCIYWFAAWLTGFAALYLDEAIGAYSFLVWCGFTIIYWVLIFFFVPETEDKTTEEIEILLMKSNGSEKKMIHMSANL